MGVYVDSAANPLGRMRMCHMLADSDDELCAMAAAIGVDVRHHQDAGTWRSHFDICRTKRALAIRLGAISISQREAAALRRQKRAAAPGAKP